MEVWEKSETVDPEVRAYVHSLVNAVGGQSNLDERYAVGDDALAVLNDLLRWLRLYDEKTNRFDVKRCLAEAALVKNDLLQILALWPEDAQESALKHKLALACLQLLVPLTWPIELEEDKTTVNHLRHTPYLKLAQVGYKRAILHCEDARILRTAIRIGLPSMALERRSRSKRDEGVIKMVLYFLRNMAMITQPQELPSQGDENEISRSATIEAFQAEDVFSLLLTVGSGASDEFQDQDVIVLETLFHLLKGVDPKSLFKQSTQLASEETAELQNLIRKEKAMLNSYNKHAPTRHNRFGTMLWVKRDDSKMSTVSGQNIITDESNTLLQMDASKKWNKPKYRGKLMLEFDDKSDFGMRVSLTEPARQHLRTFVEDFLDSSFNPLFASLRKGIEREADRLGQHTVKQYFYLISWFLEAEASRRSSVRRESEWNADRPSNEQTGDNTYAYIASVLDQETFVLLNRRMQEAYDSKIWQDLQATLLCFTQILLTVQSMAESHDEEDQEIAENIQNRIFYEESTQERIAQILNKYSNQGFAYLDAVTECVHVFVRMLERYSKQNVDLQIRSKRRARRKQKQKRQETDCGDGGQEGEPAAEDALDEAEDTAEAYRAATERKFDFTRFSGKFLTQPCVNTFVTLLHFYADLTPVQLKRCHRYFYRLAFKNDMALLLFRVDILALFHKLIKGPHGLGPAVEGFKEWEQLVQQVFRRCIKWMEREQDGSAGWKEASVVEMLFSKIAQTHYYLQHGFDKVVEKKAPRPPAELEVKRSVVGSDRIAVVVTVMLEKGMQHAVEWVKKDIKRAVEERQAWENEHSMREEMAGDEGAETAEARKQAPTIFLSPDTDERITALFRDKHLRLLLTEAGIQRLGAADDQDASWVVPSGLTADKLKELLSCIETTEFQGRISEDGASAASLIRNKSTARRGAVLSESESGSDRDVDDPQFPANLREKRRIGDEGEDRPHKKRRLGRRNRTELTEAQALAKAEERERKERERNSKIKSQLYVTASDDESDAEADAEFFRLEEDRRRKMDGVIRSALLKERESAAQDVTKMKKSGGTKRKKPDEFSAMERERPAPAYSFASSDEPLSSGDGADEGERSPVWRNPYVRMNDESSSSEDLSEEEYERPLKEVSGNRTVLPRAPDKARIDSGMADEDDEDEAPITRPAMRRHVRAGFIVESDSE